MVSVKLDVIVAVCTYRRPEQLSALLRLLQEQQFPGVAPPSFEVLVVDNSPDGEAADVIRSSSGPITVQYVPHGAGNISSGRNATLRMGRDSADFLALVDDDELPGPTWLHELLSAQRATNADIITGPVLATYPAQAPAWLVHETFYSVVGPRTGAFVDEAVSGNAMISCELLRRLDLWFDESLGTSGGEDQLFFRSARASGAILWFAPGAVVRETVPEHRLRPGYLLRREFRKGSTLGLLDRSRPGWPQGRPVRRLLAAGHWALTGVVGVAVALTHWDRSAGLSALMRLARSAGMLAGLRGRNYDLYDVPSASQPVIVLVTNEDPGYQAAGHSQYLAGFVRHYRDAGARVVVLVTEPRLGFLGRRISGAEVYRSPVLRSGFGVQLVASPRAVAGLVAWRVFRGAPQPLQRLADRARSAFRRRRQVDHVLGVPLTPAQSAFVTRTLDAERPQVVLFSGLFALPSPLILPTSVRARVLIAHDVVSTRAEQFRSKGYQVEPDGFTAKDEADAMRAFSTVAAIQWDDAQTYRRLAPHADVVVTPVSVGPSPLGRAAVIPDRCLFVGSGSLHNLDGLRWFLDSCWSGVRASRASTELHVFGTVCARLGLVPAGVVLRGEVADLAVEYARAAVALVPLQAGSGLKVKIVEAICRGVPIVTTSVGAQGLMALEPLPFLVADTAPDFTERIVRLLNDPDDQRRLQQVTREAAPLFSPDRVFNELDQALNAAGVPLPGIDRR